MRIWLICIFLALYIPIAYSQTPTETPTPAPTDTSTPSNVIYATIAPESGAGDGQETSFAYTATAGDVQIVNVLLAIFFTLWAQFMIYVFGLRKPLK